MGNRRVLILGAGRGAAIAALLAAKGFETVALVDAPARAPSRLIEDFPQMVDAPFAMPTERRRRAQWKDEIHGRKKP